MSWQDKGVRLRRKPTRALDARQYPAGSIAAFLVGTEAYIGVGLPNV